MRTRRVHTHARASSSLWNPTEHCEHAADIHITTAEAMRRFLYPLVVVPAVNGVDSFSVHKVGTLISRPRPIPSEILCSAERSPPIYKSQNEDARTCRICSVHISAGLCLGDTRNLQIQAAVKNKLLLKYVRHESVHLKFFCGRKESSCHRRRAYSLREKNVSPSPSSSLCNLFLTVTSVVTVLLETRRSLDLLSIRGGVRRRTERCTERGR